MIRSTNTWAFPGGPALEEPCRRASASGFRGIGRSVADSGPFHRGMTGAEALEVLAAVPAAEWVEPRATDPRLRPPANALDLRLGD